MGFIDNTKLLQDMIDALDIQQMPGEQPKAYPLPLLPGVLPTVNLNDFLKQHFRIIQKTHVNTSTLLAGSTESFSFSDVFTEAESKNKVYKLTGIVFSIAAPAVTAPTTGTTQLNLGVVTGINDDCFIFQAVAPYTDTLGVMGNYVRTNTTVSPGGYSIASLLQDFYIDYNSGLHIAYSNNTDADQAASREVFFQFLEETVKGL